VVHCACYNKCIGDDTKAIARQSLNCIKNKKNKLWRKRFLHCNVARSWHRFRQVTAPYSVACDSGIVTVNSPSGSTLQCGRWLRWHAIEFAQMSAMLEFYFWFRFRPHHRSRHVILHQSPKFYPNRTTLGRKKWRHVDFHDGGSQPSWILGIQ